jgi:hypothetical protein
MLWSRAFPLIEREMCCCAGNEKKKKRNMSRRGSVVAFLRRYHPWQIALVCACLVLFAVGCRLLALQQSVSPDILTRKIQGNLELSFDRYSRMPGMLLGFAITMLLLPFIGTAGVAVRHRRTVYAYAVLSFCLLVAVASVAIFLTVQLAAADSNCRQISDCFQCEPHVLTVKCRVLSRFAMKQVCHTHTIDVSTRLHLSLIPSSPLLFSALCTATRSTLSASSWPRWRSVSSSGCTFRSQS